jgi:hypothetical protein
MRLTDNAFHTRFSTQLEIGGEDKIQKAIDLYTTFAKLHSTGLAGVGFHVKFSHDRETLVLYNEENPTSFKELSMYLLAIGRELNLSGIITFAYAEIAPIDLLDENSGGIVYVNFDTQNVDIIVAEKVWAAIKKNASLLNTLSYATYYT